MYSVIKLSETSNDSAHDGRKYVDISFPANQALRGGVKVRRDSVPEVFIEALGYTPSAQDHASLVIRVSTEEPVEAARLAKLSVGGCRFPMTQQLRFLRDLAIVDGRVITDSPTGHGWACLLLHALEDPVAPCPKALVRALDIIEQKLGLPLLVDAVARDCAVSRRKLHALFQDHLGIPPYEYIRKRRAERAIELLTQHPQMSIADIALATGHQDQSGLTRALKSQFQVTPAAYRRSMGQHRKVTSSIASACLASTPKKMPMSRTHHRS